MHPIGAVRGKRAEVKTLQQGQLLQEHWTLAPRSRLVHPVAAVVVTDRLLQGRAPMRHVIRGKKGDIAPPASVHLWRPSREPIDRLGDEAAVEGLASRFDLPISIAAGRL